MQSPAKSGAILGSKDSDQILAARKPDRMLLDNVHTDWCF